MARSVVVSTLGMLTFIMIIGNSMFVPVLPDMEIMWDITSTQAGLILSVFSLSAAITIPLTGFLTGQFSKKTIATYAIAIVVVGCLVSALSGSLFVNYAYPMLLMGRVVQGIGAGIVAPLPFMITAELLESDDRVKVLAAIEVFNGIAKLVSPFAGMFTIQYGGSFLFIFYMGVCILAIVLLLLGIRTIKPTPLRTWKSYFTALKHIVFHRIKDVFPLIFIGGGAMCLLFGFLTYYSYELEWIYGQTGMTKAFLFTLPLIGLIIGSILTGKLVERHRKINLGNIFKGVTILLAICFFLLLLHETLWLLIIITTLIGGSSATILVICNLLITENVLKEERDIIVSLYSMVRFIGVGVGPPLFTVLMYNEEAMFVSLFTVMVLLGIVCQFLLKCRLLPSHMPNK
ncbi:MFS transporter [Bacillus sp. A116_S68]|nr:MFS transporter [Bacillus sp. A116_S68]